MKLDAAKLRPKYEERFKHLSKRLESLPPEQLKDRLAYQLRADLRYVTLRLDALNRFERGNQK